MKGSGEKLLEKPYNRKEIYDTFQQQIADTYLKAPGTGPVNKTVKVRHDPKIPWIVALFAVIVATWVLFSKSNIDVKIRIMGEIPSVRTVNGEDNFYNVLDKGVYLIKGAAVNDALVKEALFLGDARTYSRIAGDQLVLCNSKGAGWSSYSIELAEPIDMRRLDIKFTARGERGEEHLGIVLVDADNRTYRLRRDRSVRLTKEWETYSVSLKSIKSAINLKEVSAIRFEFGSLTVGNSSVATIYLKDIYAAKARKARWL